MALNWRFHQDDEGLGSLWKYRCEICTLRCPCPHVPRYRLAEMNKKRVSQYPLNADAEICHEFFRTKYCTSYEVRGWCHFAHPVPNLVMPVRRCDVCTKKITKKYCYLHRPPIGECVGDDDKAVLTIGSDVKEKFKPGEIVGYNSALERSIIYGIVAYTEENKRVYDVAVTATGSRFISATHNKLFRIHGNVSKGWEKIKRIAAFLAKKRKTSKKKKKEESSGPVDWSKMFGKF